MIAHVAEAGEQRGRVVLRLTHGRAHPMALEAAIRVAQAFQSEIESLFIEDQQLFELASFSFAREISLTGRRRQALSPESIALDLQHAAAALQRRIGVLARLAEIPLRVTVVRDEPVNAVVHACAACGPWNVVALAEPLSADSPALLRQLFAAVGGTTGIVGVGPNACRTSGPIVAEIEDIADLEPMLRTAGKLLAVTGAESLSLLLVGRNDSETLEMEGQARLILGAEPAATILRASIRHGAPIELAEQLRRSGCGFILARFGSLLVPADGDLDHLTQTLECPLFLIR